MRVAHVFKDYFPPTTGGIEQHMHLLCAGLAETIDVSVLVPSRSRKRVEEKESGIRVIRVPEYGRYASVPLCPTASYELRRLQPDLIHLHFPNPMGDLSCLLGSAKVPFVVAYHSDIIKQRSLLPLYKPVLGLLLRKARRIIVASHEYLGSSEFLAAWRDKCAVIPYGVDLASFALRNGEAAEVVHYRDRLKNRILIFVGVARYYKGLDILLQAMTKVRGSLLIVGRDTLSLKRRAEELGIEERVLLLGEVSSERLRVLLNAADVFVLPSIDRCEAFGIAQLEAMACGKPVISSDLPTGMRLANQDNITGFLVQPGNPNMLADAINRLLDDPALCAALGQAARRRVEREFGAELMISRTMELYREILH